MVFFVCLLILTAVDIASAWFMQITVAHGDMDMKLDEIKEIAKQLNIKTGKMKKAELVTAIQQAEQNDPCFGTGSVDSCGQSECLWREDCL